MFYDYNGLRVFMRDYLNIDFPGRLFVVEGIDGSGKSTQLKLLHQWLLNEGYGVFFSEWNSSPLVRSTTKRGKDRKLLTPTTFSLIHATDFADRIEKEIIPPLKAGAIVLADRYIYTAFSRDVARGVNPDWVRKLYSFAVKPHLAFYFKVPLNVALDRILSGRAQIKYYEAGMDLNLSPDINDSFKLFQESILLKYDKIVNEYGLIVIDATLPIKDQQKKVREVVLKKIKELKKFPKRLTFFNNMTLSGN